MARSELSENNDKWLQRVASKESSIQDLDVDGLLDFSTPTGPPSLLILPLRHARRSAVEPGFTAGWVGFRWISLWARRSKFALSDIEDMLRVFISRRSVLRPGRRTAGRPPRQSSSGTMRQRLRL